MVVVYVVSCVSPRIRKFASGKAVAISESLEVNAAYSVTVIALVIAAVAILGPLGNQGSIQERLSIHRGLEWLAAATLFALAQFILTRQVGPVFIYLAVAMTDSLWWCLSWALWLVYRALLPNDAWTTVLLIGPLGVAFMVGLNVVNMRKAGKNA
jgi:hypothetical protein